MIKDIPGLIEHLKTEITKRCDVAIIGLSGGADSTLVAILCMLALGKEQVIGVHMPYNDVDTKGTKFNARSVRLARKLGICEKYIPITKIADSITSAMVGTPTGTHIQDFGLGLSTLDCGNARARARMCVLYGISGFLAHGEFYDKRIRVIGTGNLSEDFVGYDTKGGDALADFHPIGRLFKSEVYQLLSHFRDAGIIDEEHIDRVPSAGLWADQTDESELGHTYAEMEPVVKRFLEDDRETLVPCLTFSDKEVDLARFVEARHCANKHKHSAIPSFEVTTYVD